jgi:hypothetical protein
MTRNPKGSSSQAALDDLVAQLLKIRAKAVARHDDEGQADAERAYTCLWRTISALRREGVLPPQRRPRIGV